MSIFQVYYEIKSIITTLRNINFKLRNLRGLNKRAFPSAVTPQAAKDKTNKLRGP
jgi:hypothetical protein